jgi:hypothetical protein
MTDLLIKLSESTPNLEKFVEALPKLIGCGPWQERESSNYPPELRYSQCAALGVDIEAYVQDDCEFDQYPVQLFFKTNFRIGDDKFLVELADCVARQLVLTGFEVLRPFDSSRTGKGGVCYRRDQKAGEMPWEQIVTEPL